MFSVSIKGLKDFKREIASASKEVKQIVSAEVQSAGAEFTSLARRDVPIDQAKLKSAISYYNVADLSVGIVAQTFYAAFMEFGTKGKYRAIPGTEEIAASFKGYKGGDFMELLRSIAAWVKRKGIAGRYSVKTRKRVGNKSDRQKEDLSAAWPIALSILKNGINPHPFFYKQTEIVWPKMISRIEKALKNQTKVSVILPGELRKPKII
jgi:hypothetical protein